MTNNPPIIADVFHRAGLIEKWGRGTNRVIAMCKKHGAPPPLFEERQGFLIVTFRAQLVAGGAAGTSGAQSEAQSIRVLGALSRGALSARALADALGMRSKTGALKRTLSEMLSETLIEYTLPDKPNSRLQKYRLTLAGERALKERFGKEDR
jgi:ATP-dependent DNA helicase RecG